MASCGGGYLYDRYYIQRRLIFVFREKEASLFVFCAEQRYETKGFPCFVMCENLARASEGLSSSFACEAFAFASQSCDVLHSLAEPLAGWSLSPVQPCPPAERKERGLDLGGAPHR